MRSLAKTSTFTMLSLLICLALSVNQSLSCGGQKSDSLLPKGDWTIGFSPYLGKDFRTIPIIVKSVVSDSEKAAITKVLLKNQTSKAVTSVRLTWFLSSQQNPENTLTQGDTPLIALSGGIPENSEREIEFPIISLAKAAKPLLKDDSLSGDFRIEVVVSHIIFQDDSAWTRSENRRLVSFIPNNGAKFIKANLSIGQTAGACSFTQCRLGSGGAGYYCLRTGMLESCKQSDDFKKCTNTICDGIAEL